MSPPAPVLFDLDGTLADTVADLAGALKDMLDERGMPAPDVETLRPLASHGSRHMLALGFGIASADEVPDSLRQEYLQRYIDRHHEDTELFCGIRELLAEFDTRSIPWGIVTSKLHVAAESLLDCLRIYPACLVCPEQVLNAKPSPEPVLRALEILGKKAEGAVYIGDHRNDLVAGREAGTLVVGCAWGYGLQEADRELCDFRARSPEELHRWLFRPSSAGSKRL